MRSSIFLIPRSLLALSFLVAACGPGASTGDHHAATTEPASTRSSTGASRGASTPGAEETDTPAPTRWSSADDGEDAQGSSALQPSRQEGSQLAAPASARPERGGLTEEEIATTIHARDADVHACYERHIRRGRERYGRVVVRFEIQSDGTVTDVELEESTLTHRRVERCILDVVATIEFDTFEGGAVPVAMPFEFSSSHASFAEP